MGRYPTTVEGFSNIRMDGSLYQPIDTWNSLVDYKLLGPDKLQASSNGPDGVAGTRDDTVVTRVYGDALVFEQSYNRRKALDRLRRHLETQR